jgi:predicted RNase H-like nuclease
MRRIMAIPDETMPSDKPERPMVRGVDGCPAGWIAVTIAAEGAMTPCVTITRDFAELTEGVEKIAVDMPFGLPERSGPGGRGPEALVRPLIATRRSSVFSVPSREAIRQTSYPDACRTALATSDPPRKISKQAFFLFPKIREVDGVLRSDPTLPSRVFETHPEVAFRTLNGGNAMRFAKSRREGLDERRHVLGELGFDRAFLGAPIGRGAKADDFLDACICALVARRIHAGIAQSFPDPPGRDLYGLPVAIWA